MEKVQLSSLERRSIAALASIYGLRMFGLFLILPVLAIYAEQLEGATPTLMGLALGVYGFTQALFQIPFGVLSDKYGRKPMIFIGLSLFALGSLVAAASDSVFGVIIGRALQGSGAIAAVVLALTSDLTRENQRAKAMAFIGMSIGLSFMLALIVAPSLSAYIGVKGLFALTAALSLIAMLLVWKAVPTPVQTVNLEVRAVPSKMWELLRHPQLIRLDAGIFCLHFVLTAMFVVVPMILVEQHQLVSEKHWQVYVSALLGSIVLMVPMIIVSSKTAWVKRIFIAGIVLLLIAQCLLVVRPFGLVGFIVCLLVFFWGFNLLEAMLPSLVSRVAPAAAKGSAMGVYNTFQFMGVFLGGSFGGYLYGQFGVNAVFLVCGVTVLLWMMLAYYAPPLQLLESMTVKINAVLRPELNTELESLEGVEQVVLLPNERVAYLKVDQKKLDKDKLSALIN